MTDKYKIKEEIERRILQCYKCLAQDLLERERNETNCCLQQYKELIQFIDSFPEEHNEDLEEASAFYANTHTEYFDSEGNPHVMPAFKAGAEWQLNQMKEALQTEYEKGRFDMREEMMKDAVEGTIKYEIGSAEIPQCDRRYQVLSDQVYIPNAKLGDKAKIIIIKEEKK